MVKGVWRALAMALVLVALYGLASTHGLDVAKSQQGWRPAGEGSTGQLLLEDSLEALVVRDGAVTASFSVESSLLQAMTFELPSMFNAPFLSLFPRLYVELAQQSHFLVRHDSPVEVVNFGVVDGVGQSSRSDPALKVSAVFKHYNAMATASATAVDESQGQGSPYLYHLALDYECAAEDPVRRLIVVQLRTPTAPSTEPKQSSTHYSLEQAHTLTFVFRKQCPLPPPPEPAAEEYARAAWPIASLFTSWGGPRGGSLLITTSSSSGEESLIRSRHPAMVMVSVDHGLMLSQSQQAELMQQPPTYGHRRAPDRRERSDSPHHPGSLLQRVFDMPAWLSDILSVVGMATILMVVVMALVDLLRGLIGSISEGDELEEMGLGEYEAVPLLTSDKEEEDEMIIIMEEVKCPEELAKPNPETLTTTGVEAQESTKPAEQLLP